MLKVFESLQAEMDAATDHEVQTVMPDEPVRPSDTLMGTVPAEIRRLWLLYRRRNSEMYTIRAEAELAPTEAQAALALRYSRLRHAADLIRALYWFSIREMEGMRAAADLSVRKGWQIVEPGPELMSDILRERFGADLDDGMGGEPTRRHETMAH